jgi:hypothetical protein
MANKDGLVKLSDGTILKLKIALIEARDIGFSPFGGVNITVKPMGGIAVQEVPETIIKGMSEKPLAPVGPEPPKDGWEIVEITEYEPAYVEEEVKTSKGPFRVRVQAEPAMASVNYSYRTETNEPLYWLNWIYKISWKPAEGK